MSPRPINTNKRGSIIVDASVCLPFFIVALALLLMLTVEIGIEENMTGLMTRCSLISIEAAAAAGKSDDFFVTGNLSWRASWHAGLNTDIRWKQADTGIPRFYSDLDIPIPGGVRVDGLVMVRVGNETSLPSIKGFTDELDSVRTVVFRPFRGESGRVETDDDDPRVYVFPKRGARFHIEGCSVMQEGTVETILTGKLRKQYAPCSICKPDQLPDGARVYRFLETSSLYHRKDCACITKSYVSMPRSQALSQGYTPCHICGGGY